MRREWSGIDRLRLDKFYLLLRTFLRTTLEYLQKGRWEPRMVTAFMGVYSRGTLEVKDNHAALVSIVLKPWWLGTRFVKTTRVEGRHSPAQRLGEASARIGFIL